MKQLWIILAFAVQAMCCGSGWAFDINGPLGPGGGGILGDAGTNPGITDDCQCSYLMVYLSPMCQDLNVGCTITGKVVGITYGGSCDVLLTLRTYPTNVLQFVTNTTVDGINTEYLTDFLSVTSSCSAGIIETNFVVRGLTTTPEGQFSGLIAELYKCGALCGVYTQKLDVVQLQGITVSPQAAQVNEDVIFTAQMSPAGSGGSILNWSGGGKPTTGTGTVFTTRWSDLGTHTITARCGINSECGGTTSVNVPVVPSLNLEYNALPEETQPTPHEENPGGFICLNDDNDDEEVGIDKDRPTTAPELAVADPDLKKVKLSMTPVPTTGIMTLTIPAGLRVWANAKKKSVVTNQWNLAVPAEKTAFELLLAGGIWLEGTGTGSGDLKLAYGTTCADKIKMTILKVELKEGTTVINEDDYVYITGTPQMPQLKASLKPTGLSGNAKWRLYVEYTRPDRGNYTGDKEYYPGPDASTWKTVSAAATWDIAAEFGTQFRGGKATLYCDHQGVQCQQIFHIRGNNPTEAAAKAYLNANGPWFAYCIAKHESGTQSGRTYLQFNEVGTLGPNPADYKYCPTRGAGGAPYGWGMMQLDNIELPGQTTYRSPDNGDPWAQELWSWKTNCDTAFQVLTRKGDISTAHLKTIAPDGAGGYIMPPDITVSGVSFTGGGAHTPDHLDVIKLYNGGYFWTAYDPILGWTHVTIGGPTKDYTEKVLDEY